MLRLGRVDFSVGAARPAMEGDLEFLGSQIKMGYCWWFWLPSLRWNKGKFWRHEVTDVNFHWLRFWAAVTVWGN